MKYYIGAVVLVAVVYLLFFKKPQVLEQWGAKRSSYIMPAWMRQMYESRMRRMSPKRGRKGPIRKGPIGRRPPPPRRK